MASQRTRTHDKLYDATYVGVPAAKPKKAIVAKEKVLSFDNFFSDVKTHPSTSLRPARKPNASGLSPTKTRPGAGGAAKPAAQGAPKGLSSLRGTAAGAALVKTAAALARPSSAASLAAGALAAERSLRAAQARGSVASTVAGLAVHGNANAASGKSKDVTVKAHLAISQSIRRTLVNEPPAVRHAVKGRASAAVAARLAHIDALLASSKAAAGGTRGYGACWPAKLGGTPGEAALLGAPLDDVAEDAAPAAAERMRTPTPAAPSPLPPAQTGGGAAEEAAAGEWDPDWEVAEAMKGAEWAVADWEEDGDAPLNDDEDDAVMAAEPEPQAELAVEARAPTPARAATPAAAEKPPTPAPTPVLSEAAAAAEAMFEGSTVEEIEAVTLRLQAVQRGRNARAQAKKLREERNALGELADLSGALVEGAIAAAMASICAQENA